MNDIELTAKAVLNLAQTTKGNEILFDDMAKFEEPIKLSESTANFKKLMFTVSYASIYQTVVVDATSTVFHVTMVQLNALKDLSSRADVNYLICTIKRIDDTTYNISFAKLIEPDNKVTVNEDLSSFRCRSVIGIR